MKDMVKTLTEELNSKTKIAEIKKRIPEIKTLAMLKMEKNFIAHIEKGYPRQPYKAPNQTISFLFYRLSQELKELGVAINKGDYAGMKEELADLSNLTDYTFEKIVQEETKKGDK